MSIDYYSVLEVPYNATPEEVRSAYFQLARVTHPDVNQAHNAREAFIALQKAYEVLSDPKKRADYDSTLPVEQRQGPAISINARYSQPVMRCMSEPQLAYVLVDLICSPELNGGNPAPYHICFVLDKSTSMKGQRMDMVKASTANLLQQARPQDIISVVAFGDRAEVVVPPTRASSLSKSDHRINLLQPGGGTEILQGLDLGIQQLRKTNSSYIRQIILLTDGYTYGDDAGCIALAKEAATEGITITVLGIGSEWNDALMDQIASTAGGNTRYITGPRDLDHFLLQNMADLESVYARGLRFVFESASGVELRYVFRITPNIGPLETKSPILFGDIHHRKTMSLLFEFLIPGLPEPVERLNLASGKIWMEMIGRSRPGSRIMLDLHCSVKKNVEPDSPPAPIVEAMSRLTLYRLQEKIRQEVGQGQVDRATRHMHYLATSLLSHGNRELAHTVLVEAEHIQQSRRFSGEGEKRIKYGTRALLLPPGSELNV
jgi:Ca-activated chloride channel family protein